MTIKLQRLRRAVAMVLVLAGVMAMLSGCYYVVPGPFGPMRQMVSAVVRLVVVWPANLAHVEMLETRLEKADLHGANLTEGSFFRANFLGSKLIGATLDRTNLTLASLVLADLAGASLRYARLNRANFSGANIDGAAFAHADASELSTWLPPGMPAQRSGESDPQSIGPLSGGAEPALSGRDGARSGQGVQSPPPTDVPPTTARQRQRVRTPTGGASRS
jgi:hypothetical protein